LVRYQYPARVCVIGQRLEYAGIGSGCGLLQAKAWEAGF
jgi:hypothetical protein